MPAPATCDRCPALVSCRRQVVNGRGASRPRALFVGQNPGKAEDEQGKCFVGPSGHVLASLMREAGIEIADCRWVNAVRCLTPGNRKPSAEEMVNCRPYLVEEIAETRPDIIVLLGATAIESLYGRVPVDSVAGQTLTLPDSGVRMVPTYHPAAVLRSWKLAPLVLAHFRKVARLLAGEGDEDGLGDYRIIDSVEKLEVLRDYLQAVEFVALDSETTGTDWKTDEILDVSFSGAPGEGFDVPLFDRELQPLDCWRGRYPEAVRLIGEILASPVPKALQGGAFDLRFFERRPDDDFVTAATAFGWRVENLQHDTLLYHRALAEYLPKESRPNELGHLTSLYTSMPPYEEELRRQTRNKTRMDLAHLDVRARYAAADADAVSRLAPLLRGRVEEEGMGWLMDNVTVPMVRCCHEMTRRGILVDRPYFDKLCAYYTARIEGVKKGLHELGGDFNPNAPVQVQDVLFNRLDLPRTGRKTASSRECEDCARNECAKHDQVDRATLTQLNDVSPHPILPLLLEYKELAKMKGTYLDGSDGEGGFAYHIRADGRIHPQFNVGGAETGRSSSSEPNLQNPPHNVVVKDETWGIDEEDAFRRCFVAPEGSVLMEADWSQLEVWVNAYLAEDWEFLELLQLGRDVHVHVARNIPWPGFDFPLEPDLDDGQWREKYQELRRRGKDFVFGTQFGLTVAGVQERQGCDEDEAKRLLDLYFDLRPKLREYIDSVRDQVRRGETLSNPFGRLRHFPQVPIMRASQKGAPKMLYHGINTELEGLVREGINFPTQSGGSDLHSLAHVWSEEAPELLGRASPVIAVHDSVLSEADAPDPEFVVDTAWIVKENWQRIARETVLPDGKKLGWQIPVEVTWGRSWGRPERKLTAKGDLIDL